MTLGPIMDDARLDKPKSPKNYTIVGPREAYEDDYTLTHHVIETRWGKFSHHCLRKSIIWCLEKAKNDVVCPMPKKNSRDRLFKSNHKTYQNSQTLWKLHKAIIHNRDTKVLSTRTRSYLSRYQACPRKVS